MDAVNEVNDRHQEWYEGLWAQGQKTRNVGLGQYSGKIFFLKYLSYIVICYGNNWVMPCLLWMQGSFWLRFPQFALRVWVRFWSWLRFFQPKFFQLQWQIFSKNIFPVIQVYYALLSLSPTSVEAERAFSWTGNLVTKLCTRLSDQMISQCSEGTSWMNQNKRLTWENKYVFS